MSEEERGSEGRPALYRVRAGRIIAGLALAISASFIPFNVARHSTAGLVVDLVVAALALLQLLFVSRANRLFPAAIAAISLFVIISLVGAQGYVQGYFWANAAPLLLFFFAGPRWGAVLTAILGLFVAGLAWMVPPVTVPNHVEASIFVSYAAIAVFAWVNERQRLTWERELERVSQTDELTSLVNRRHFAQRLEQEFARASRSGRSFAIALIDADHFKEVNDRFGHAAGDEVLKAISALLRDESRTSDVPARLGGDEFALLLPEADREAARVAAERVHAASLAQPLLRERGVTLTIGIAAFSPGESSERVLQRADEAMYEAKRLGRNRVAG